MWKKITTKIKQKVVQNSTKIVRQYHEAFQKQKF